MVILFVSEMTRLKCLIIEGTPIENYLESSCRINIILHREFDCDLQLLELICVGDSPYWLVEYESATLICYLAVELDLVVKFNGVAVGLIKNRHLVS